MKSPRIVQRSIVQRHKGSRFLDTRTELLPRSRVVCDLSSSSQCRAAEWALRGAFFSVTSTAEELSIVCSGAQVPAGIVHENGWGCVKLHGPFPFSESGILASFVRPLSERAIPIFAVSTFDTDYVLVKQEWVEKAVQALREAGHVETNAENP